MLNDECHLRNALAPQKDEPRPCAEEERANLCGVDPAFTGSYTEGKVVTGSLVLLPPGRRGETWDWVS